MDQMASSLPPLTWGTFAHHWAVHPWWLFVAALLLVGYLGMYVECRLRGVRRPVGSWRVASFVAGTLLLAFTVSSAIDVYAMAVFWDHMVEHLLLIMLVPALLVVGHPLTLLRAVAGTRGRAHTVDAVLNSPPVAVLTHPLVTAGLYAAVIVATHLTGFMNQMAMHSWLMGAEQVLYVVTGYLFLLPLIGYEPIRWQLPTLGRLLLLLVGMTPDTVVGVVLMQATHDMFPVMEAGHPAWAPPPLQDLGIGGGLMWAGGDGLMMAFGLGLVIAMISAADRGNVLGRRLESVRRSTMAEHVARGGAEGPALADNVDVDDDDAMLDAYNRMLGRLGQEPPPR